MGLMDEYKDRKRQIAAFVIVTLLLTLVLGIIPLIVLASHLGKAIGL